MATTIGGALNALIQGSSLDLPEKVLHLDFAPPNTIPPYVTYNDDVSLTPALKGDGKGLQVTRTVQINLWQKGNEEDMNLFASLLELLDGAQLVVQDYTQTFKVAVTSAIRLEEPEDSELVHHEVSVDITHPAFIP